MGKLSLWELAEVEEKIKTDPSFAEEVAFERDLLIGIRESRRLELKETLKQLEAEPKISILRQVVDTLRIARFDLVPRIAPYAIAACIIIFVAGSIFYPTISDALTPNSKRTHYSNVE